MRQELARLGLDDLQQDLLLWALEQMVRGDLERQGVGRESGFRSRSNIYRVSGAEVAELVLKRVPESVRGQVEALLETERERVFTERLRRWV